MSFDLREGSNYQGVPTTLYEFSLGTTYWRYAASENNVVLNGVTYSALAISNQGYSSSGNPETDEMNVSLDAYAEITQLYLGTPPSEPVQLRVRTLHRGDTEAPVVWAGQVKSGKQVSTVEFSFVCNSLLSTLNRNGLRLSWGRGCPHALYDRSCRVDPDDYATTVMITSMSGNTVVAGPLSLLGDDYLSGGFLSFVGQHGATERRAIKRHVGSSVTLLGPADGLVAGMWIIVYPGCNRITSTCETKFNNLANYGGFPHLPTKSPFDGDPIF